MRRLLLAHDLGTGSDKACLFDVEGNFVADANVGYDTYYAPGGIAEHDPASWWKAVCESTNEVMIKAGAAPEEVQAISFSAHAMAVVPFDKDGNSLTDRIMLWMDARSQEEAKHILSRISIKDHYAKTGCTFDMAMYFAAKVMWIQKHQPDIYKNTYKFGGTKEYLIKKMTGNLEIMDYTEASLTGLYNINTHEWDADLLKISNMDEEKFLKPSRVTSIAGELTTEAAEEMGIKAGIPVILGSWDNYACATGGGVRTRGNMVGYIGTAGWLGLNIDKHVGASDVMPNVVYAGEGNYFTTVHTNSACGSFEWVLNNMCRDIMMGENPYAVAEKMARSVKPGADKLFFLPAMMSGNTMYSDSALAGTFAGLTMAHTEAHVIRAAMEGVAMDLMMCANIYKKMGAMPTKAALIGGGAKNNLWHEMLASMCGVEIFRPANMRHIGAQGAAIVAGVGSGLIKDFDMAAKLVESDDIAVPDPEMTAIYEKLLPVFESLYKHIIPLYHEVQAI